MGIKERKTREKEARKLAILKAARHLASGRRFRDVRVSEIAKKVEVSKGSIYLYFQSKEEIYSLIFLNDLEDFHRRLTGIIREDKSCLKMLLDFADIYIDASLRRRGRDFCNLMEFALSANQTPFSDDAYQNLVRQMNKSIDLIVSILNLCVQRGELSPEIDVWKTRNAIWGMLNGIISLFIFSGKEANRKEAIRSTVSQALICLVRGMSTHWTEGVALSGDADWDGTFSS